MNKSFDELITGYLNNSLNDEELHYFLDIIKGKEYEQDLKNKISGLFHNPFVIDKSGRDREEIIFNNIMLLANAKGKIKKEHDERRKAKVVRFRRIAMAACIIGLIASATHLVMYVLKKESNKISVHKFKNDVPPGSNKATLTLADGSSIVLDDAEDGALAQQGGVKVIKIGGKLAYHATNKALSEVEYNTITTPR